MARFEIDCGDGQEWLAIEADDAEDAAVEYTRDHAADVLLCPGRMLSVDEMRRLSGFPAGYVLTGTRREQTAQLGNAVPPPLARHVVRTIMEVV